MAQHLRSDMSVEKNRMFGKRHVSLCDQFPGGEVLVDMIKPCINDIDKKIANFKYFKKELIKANDMLIYETTNLKNQLRTAADIIRGYDRENPGAQLMKMIFPDKLTPVLYTNTLDTPGEISKIVTKIQSLGKEHSLYNTTVKLTEKINNCKIAIKNCDDAGAKLKIAEAELEVAHVSLLRQYSINIYEAKKIFGSNTADLLFPKVRRKKG